MKAKDIRTIKSLISEYGMNSGISTPSSQQQTGSTAKATAAAKPQKSSLNKPQNSPSSQQNKTDVEAPAPVEPTVSKAKELAQDFEYQDDKGDIVKVVSPIDNGLNKDAVVVQNQKNKEFYTLSPDEDITTSTGEEAVTEKADLHKTSRRKHKLKSKMKRLLRAQKHIRQGEPIFEINFNQPALAKQALSAPVKCGFEAETVWTELSGGNGDNDSDFLDGMSWGDISEMIESQAGNREIETLEESFREWIQETDYFYDAEREVIDELVRERKDTEEYTDLYVEDSVSMDDVDEYKEMIMSDLAKDADAEEAQEEKEERDSWEEDAWAREFVEVNEADAFEEWLIDDIRDKGESWDEAWEQVLQRYDMDTWVQDEYRDNWGQLLSNHDIYLYDESGGGQEEVAQYLGQWAENNSFRSEVEAGEYHSGTAVDNDYWRVEDDSSIDGSGLGSELISPVYDTPQDMLKEIKSLFDWMSEEQAVETNSSTGLHITMSMAESGTGETNKLKMALLLGDKYLLKQFNRSGNSYTASQQERIKKYVEDLTKDQKAEKSLAGLEEILSSGISAGKFSSINFKEQNNSEGNKLIEFRVAGGSDYTTDVDLIVKTVIRYAAVMQAGHDKDAYRADYIKALFRMLNSVDQIDPDTEKNASSYIDPSVADIKVIDAFKDIASKRSYKDALEYLGMAYTALGRANTLASQDKQKELPFEEGLEEAGQSKHFPKMKIGSTSDRQKHNRLKKHSGADSTVPDAYDPARAKLRKKIDDIKFKRELASFDEDFEAETEEETETLDQARQRQAEFTDHAKKYFSKAFAMIINDMAQGQNRNDPKVKQIAGFRKAFKDFDIPGPALWDMIKKEKLFTRSNINIHQREANWAEGFNKLLKLNIAKARVADFNINFTAGQDTVFMTDEYKNYIADAGDMNIFGSEEGAVKTNPGDKLKPEMFTVVPEKELTAVERAVYDYDEAITDHKSELETVASMQRDLDAEPSNDLDLIDPDHPAHAQGSGTSADPVATARKNFEIYNQMIVNGANRYLEPGAELTLADYLNRTGNSEAGKNKIIKAIKHNADIANGSALRWSQVAAAVTAYNAWETTSESMNESSDGTKASALVKAIEVRKERAANHLDLAGIKKKELDAFEKKYGFVPKSVRYGRSGYSVGDMGRVNTEMQNYIANVYNVSFNKLKESKNMFENFNKLPLRKQLEIVSKVDSKKINEALTVSKKKLNERHSDDMRKKTQSQLKAHEKAMMKSAKDSIKKYDEKNKKNETKGFEHPNKSGSGRKAKYTEGAVPDNSPVKKIRQLLNVPLLASDLKSQMEAYFVVPDPSMIRAFREAASGGGPDTDLRTIFRGFVQNKVHPETKKKAGITESKSELIKKLAELPDDEKTTKLVNYIEQLLDDMGVGGKIQSLSSQLGEVPDEDVKKAIKQIAKIIASIEMTPAERAKLFMDWKQDKLIRVDTLLSTSTDTMAEIFVGYGLEGNEHITELVDDLNEVVQYGIGPGEFALSVLSQRIGGMGAGVGADDGKGDLMIDGQPIELKTTRKNSARFNDRQVTVSDSYKTKVTAFFTKYDEKFKELEAQGAVLRVKSGMQQNHVAAFLKLVPEAEKEVAEIISNIFTELPNAGDEIAQYLAQNNINGAMQSIAQSNVNNYLASKRQGGNLKGILFLDLKKKTFTFIQDVKDLAGSGLRLHSKTNYLVTTNENPFANTAIVDSSN